MVIAETYYRPNPDGSKDWINPADVEVQRDERGRITGATLIADGQGGRWHRKMSKSKNNGVDPQAMVDKYGADTVRLFSMFAAPPEQSLEWNDAGVDGMAASCAAWAQVQKHAADGAAPALDAAALDASQKALRRKTHETIGKVGDDYGRRHSFNTAIAAVMELMNALAKFEDGSEQGRAVRQEALQAIVLLLNPITPHASHALWQVLGHGETLLEDQPFPQADSRCAGARRADPGRAGQRQAAWHHRGGGRCRARAGRSTGPGRAQRGQVHGRPDGAQDHHRAGQDREHRRCLMSRHRSPAVAGATHAQGHALDGPAFTRLRAGCVLP
jgi:hypothetical protein